MTSPSSSRATSPHPRDIIRHEDLIKRCPGAPKRRRRGKDRVDQRASARVADIAAEPSPSAEDEVRTAGGETVDPPQESQDLQSIVRSVSHDGSDGPPTIERLRPVKLFAVGDTAAHTDGIVRRAATQDVLTSSREEKSGEAVKDATTEDAIVKSVDNTVAESSGSSDDTKKKVGGGEKCIK